MAGIWKRSLSMGLAILFMLSGFFSTVVVHAADPSDAAQAANGSILVNGGFEAPVVDGVIPGWTIESGEELVSVSSTQAWQGSKSLRVQKESGTVGVRMKSDPVTVIPDKEYVLSTDLFLERGQLAGFYVYVYNARNELIKGPTGEFTLFLRSDTSPTGQWQHLEDSFIVPDQGATVVVSLITSWTETTKYRYYLDEVSLTPVSGGEDIPPSAIKVEPSSPEFMSEAYPVQPFHNVFWSAETYRQSGTGAQAELRFFNGQDQVIYISSANINGAFGAWTFTAIDTAV